MSNQSKAQTLYFDAGIKPLSCNCKGSIDSSPLCGEDWLDTSISRDEQLLSCIFIEKDYIKHKNDRETFEVALDEVAGTLTKINGETSEVYLFKKKNIVKYSNKVFMNRSLDVSIN